ncbi:ABC transporter ATP-binding protein [Streptomyces morookaense]|uniref:ATP-binding cassette domain-containing protein n=1 Tax=Streptomyces morookaense TaxID=1970 RepID=A0A7Y7E7P5_STRMO|nr:ATP-binding cassette domain-containing protein [Streptomyces morookaense]NVK79170.1 ATP-binding cassette domain-containing protein [Streptomyces morookaense]GHF28016.1 multidrug ABC transporter ATP-binding protein [Streptomyces morookaense]
MSEAVIAATGLRKTYRTRQGEREAVRSVTLQVRSGEFFGLLGPNGAGKSTTIGMLTTLVQPTGGSAHIAGFDVVRQSREVRRRISLVHQSNAVDRELSVRENLEFRGRYWGMGSRGARARADALLEQFGLGDRRDALFYQLSGGQLRRMLIARALVHHPEVLFLDEPTVGIDPHSRAHLWDVLRELHGRGQTILMTTHNLDEAERFCRRAAIIDAGQVLACDTVGALVARAGGRVTVSATYDGPVDLAALPAGSSAELRRADVREATVHVVTEKPEGLLGELIALGSATGRQLLDMTTSRPSLENAFLELTGRTYRA